MASDGVLWLVCFLAPALFSSRLLAFQKYYYLPFASKQPKSVIMNEQTEPKLAPPGAGLPAPEHFMARILFGLKRLTGSRESFNAKFAGERDAIRKLVANLTPEKASKRVSIRRCRGLEDSSRFWSVWMTLDHLRIVHLAFIGILKSLGKGEVPAGEASTAAVKPDPAVTADVVAAYEESCDALLATIASIPNLKTTVRFPHPWFGPMDAFGWHALAGGHMSIHRVQIERILAGVA
jgi:uncharacterized damage-inducible protein DinB